MHTYFGDTRRIIHVPWDADWISNMHIACMRIADLIRRSNTRGSILVVSGETPALQTEIIRPKAYLLQLSPNTDKEPAEFSRRPLMFLREKYTKSTLGPDFWWVGQYPECHRCVNPAECKYKQRVLFKWEHCCALIGKRKLERRKACWIGAHSNSPRDWCASCNGVVQEDESASFELSFRDSLWNIEGVDLCPCLHNMWIRCAATQSFRATAAPPGTHGAIRPSVSLLPFSSTNRYGECFH